jgi:hypothetical protein
MALKRDRHARIPAAFFPGMRVPSRFGVGYTHENWSKVIRLAGKNALLLHLALGRIIGAESLSRALTEGPFNGSSNF